MYRGVPICCRLVISKNHCVQLHNVIIILKPLISSKRLITDKKTLSMSRMEIEKNVDGLPEKVGC